MVRGRNLRLNNPPQRGKNIFMCQEEQAGKIVQQSKHVPRCGLTWFLPSGSTSPSTALKSPTCCQGSLGNAQHTSALALTPTHLAENGQERSMSSNKNFLYKVQKKKIGFQYSGEACGMCISCFLSTHISLSKFLSISSIIHWVLVHVNYFMVFLFSHQI